MHMGEYLCWKYIDVTILDVGSCFKAGMLLILTGYVDPISHAVMSRALFTCSP